MEAPVLDLEAPPSSANQAVKDLFSGAMGGIAQVMIGALASSPLD